jgi:hypothetical protein
MLTNNTKQMFLLFDSLHVSMQIPHLQVILEEYTNDGGIHVNFNATINAVGPT